jgi:hypothetical protein
MQDDDPEEIEDKPIYEIQEMPDPKFRLKKIKRNIFENVKLDQSKEHCSNAG